MFGSFALMSIKQFYVCAGPVSSTCIFHKKCCCWLKCVVFLLNKSNMKSEGQYQGDLFTSYVKIFPDNEHICIIGNIHYYKIEELFDTFR